MEDDHLNRWPLAREVYSVAVNGPPEWSVRIGVYGEWGTGKTTVLKFVKTLAEQDKNIVVWFNPWEHSSKTSLWQAFVLKIYEEAENKIGGIAAAGNARRKAALAEVKKLVKPGINVIHSGAGEVADAGLEFLALPKNLWVKTHRFDGGCAPPNPAPLAAAGVRGEQKTRLPAARPEKEKRLAESERAPINQPLLCV